MNESDTVLKACNLSAYAIGYFCKILYIMGLLDLTLLGMYCKQLNL